MIERVSQRLLLQPSDVQPSESGWNVIGVFNPAVATIGRTVYMIVRVAEKLIEDRPGMTALPYWTKNCDVSVEWVSNDHVREVDSRVVKILPSEFIRLTSVSHLQIFKRTETDSSKWEFVSSIYPQGTSESYGIEDPRITCIEDRFWITYVAVSQAGIATSLMSTQNMKDFQRHGIIFACENKDVVLFPERIRSEYVALHRPNPNSHFTSPQIWIARSPDLLYWGQLEPIVQGIESWEAERIGSGPPPILLDEGWLLLYHGSEFSRTAGQVGRYASGALLLDRDQPHRVLARLREPMMVPMTEYETSGFVPNVVFPTAVLDHGDEVEVFYGAADTSVAAARFSKRSILDSMYLPK